MGLLVTLVHTFTWIETSFVQGALWAGSMRRFINTTWQRRHNWSTTQEDFFRQIMQIERHSDRMPLITALCAGKDVLHVGCVDWPIFDSKSNLHLALAPVARTLAGLDTNAEGLETLRSHFKGTYYTHPAQIKQHFDVVLIPEVIEHVPNAAMFLAEIDTIDFDVVLVTGPNALIRPPNPWWNATYRKGNTLVEFVHPDHKCYYSPYTLRNTIESFTSWKVTRVGTTTAETAVFVQAHKAQKARGNGDEDRRLKQG